LTCLCALGLTRIVSRKVKNRAAGSALPLLLPLETGRFVCARARVNVENEAQKCLGLFFQSSKLTSGEGLKRACKTMAYWGGWEEPDTKLGLLCRKEVDRRAGDTCDVDLCITFYRKRFLSSAETCARTCASMPGVAFDNKVLCTKACRAERKE